MSDSGPVERVVVTKRRICRLVLEQENVPVEGGIFLAEVRTWSLPCRGLPGHGVIISHP
jgi:hypothetical protein